VSPQGEVPVGQVSSSVRSGVGAGHRGAPRRAHASCKRTLRPA